MTLTQVGGVLLIFLVCPLLGGLPLIRWIAIACTGKSLDQLGTGNLSVSAAFYHGGRWVGILAVLSEAAKGILAVLLARAFFPAGSAWELGALMALVMGRYWMGKGAGTTNVVWGFVVHDPVVSGLVFLMGGIGFTLVRERRTAKFGVLALLTLLTALLHPDQPERVLMTAALSGLIGWIYTRTPDDLGLQADTAQGSSQAVFRFFQGDRALRSLDNTLDADTVGAKAATLATLKRLGYPVPMGWVLRPGDDPESLLANIPIAVDRPLVVRSSAIGEDSETASAAGQYLSVLNIRDRQHLNAAILRCFESYDAPAAVQYRRDRQLPDAAMSILVQTQIQGVFSGVAFSRDPVTRQGDAVVIEALPGAASQVVSGRVTPETFQVAIAESAIPPATSETRWSLPLALDLPVAGSGQTPVALIQQVAYLARHLETYYHGVPQDIEWTFDGMQLWLLQCRPVTTLLPLWTRKIAAEVIPGVIRPLTWSINRPLTCGVWGELFTLVLGDRAAGLDFTETATLHYSRAYFNATLLGQIFRRMGLPAESLEFLTRGAKFSRPPLRSTLRNLPGLWRLVQRERRLERDWQRDQQRLFAPAIAQFSAHPTDSLSDRDLIQRIEQLLDLLKVATYYSILAPLSAALRKALGRVPDTAIDASQTPELGALRSLQALALSAHPLVSDQLATLPDGEALLAYLHQTPAGQAILAQLEAIIQAYGYLSEVGTDIAVPTWREDPAPIRQLFAQFCRNPAPPAPVSRRSTTVQRRFDIKGQVTELYSRLLAELRWCFVALEQQRLAAGSLAQSGDLFLLTWSEIRAWILQPDTVWTPSLLERIAQRHADLERDRALPTVPFLVYGIEPPTPLMMTVNPATCQLQGIGASAGQVEGRVVLIRSLQSVPTLEPGAIVVVPYTDSGWAPLLAQASGLIAETGGRLSHGAIVAREYRLPAVMDVHNAMQRLQDGQRVRLDGARGVVEILEDEA